MDGRGGATLEHAVIENLRHRNQELTDRVEQLSSLTDQLRGAVAQLRELLALERFLCQQAHGVRKAGAAGG
jgi:hypothetical protein